MARRAARPGLGLAIVAVLIADVFLATNWNHTTPVTLAQSVEDFRASQPESPTAADAATPTTAPPAAVAPAPTVPTQGRQATTATTAPPRATASPTRAA